MDSVQETPAKKRKLSNGAAQNHGYSSQNDSGDEIFDDYETVATIPLTPAKRQVSVDVLSSPPTFNTQPTQIISNSTPNRYPGEGRPSEVQVPASSPAQVSPPSKSVQNVKLASSMAPAGTMFRMPNGVAKAPAPAATPAAADISDSDLPRYDGSSDDDSDSHRADIKPSVFVAGPQKKVLPHISKNENRFKEITAKSFYNPLGSNAPKPFTDAMANAYGNSRRHPPKSPQQSKPAKALPTQDLNIEDIEDFQLRSKIKRMRDVIPGYSVRACKRALETKRFNYDDAMDYMLSREGEPTIDLTISDGEDPLNQHIAPKKMTAKQHVKVKQNIQEKWTANQPIAKSLDPPCPPQENFSNATTTAKPKRRLVQGRKHPSSPIISTPPAPPSVQDVPSPSRRSSFDSEASDSAIGSEPDADLENKVFKFFNTCSTPDLADIAMITAEVAEVVLSQRPFNSLATIRQVSGEVPTKSTKKKSTKRPIGDKIVDKCLDMWAGYEAVDSLVRQCEEISKPLKADMEAWGVDVFGASTDGELGLTSFSTDASPRDSGIGTPVSFNTTENDDSDARKAGRRHSLFPQPSNMPSHITLKDYQIVGINWLTMLFDRKLSCILADDMGLGKTCQVIAFFAHLLEKGIKGPHVVIVPSSTLENWLREFSIFCPGLRVMPYYASQNERPGVQAQILNSRDSLNVIITTYTLAKQKDDNKFLRKLDPTVCVYDEGHILKNSKSAGYEAYMRIPSQFRLLLTGTPLQNNLKELTSLLGFILPSLFSEHKEDLEAIFSHKAKTNDESHAALLSDQRIARAKSMMTPFVLRRKKHQVLRHLPTKTKRIEYCDLLPTQLALYQAEEEKAQRIIAARLAGGKTGNETSNIMMALRKASIHPLLFRRLYTDKLLAKMSKDIVKEEKFRESRVDFVYQDMEVMTDMELNRLCEENPRMSPYLLQDGEWMDSGKVSKLASLLKMYKENGDRVLVFSQFTMVMDILERVMETLDMRFFRLDGRTNVEERQTMIDHFYEEQDITVFLLSTKAGGAGINLACSNKVIIFDSSFNPQDDIQAENRAHRVGQTRDVEVVRLVTKNTIEEQIHALGNTKLALDDRVTGDATGDVDDKKAAAKVESQGVKMVEEMFMDKMKAKSLQCGSHSASQE
ncbi:DNA-dependent ATPase fun30 [Lecanora helva]